MRKFLRLFVFLIIWPFRKFPSTGREISTQLVLKGKKFGAIFWSEFFSNEMLKGGHLFIVRENAFPPEIGDPFSRPPNTHLAEQ